jgi:hypothetical protein
MVIPAGGNVPFEGWSSSGGMRLNVIEIISYWGVTTNTSHLFVARAATRHFLSSCRAGKYLSLLPRQGIYYFFLIKKVNKKIKTKRTLSRAFCRACALVDPSTFLLFSCLLISIRMK